MYLEKIDEREMANLCDKLTIREMNNLYIIFCEYYNYRLGNDEEKLFKMFKENYDRCLDSTLYSSRIDTKLLDIYEFKNMLTKFNFKELYLFMKISNFLYTRIRSEYYKNLYRLSSHLFKDYAEFIMAYKNLDSMTKEEMEYYLNNLSTSALDNYCMCIKSKNEIPTVDEMYDYFHDIDIKGKRLVR